MEIQSIVKTLIRRWWIFAAVFVVVFGATALLTLRQKPVYKSTATYIMRLSSQITEAKTISTALDILNRNDDLQGTYSEIAMSQMIKREAASKLGISNNDLRNLSVSSRAVNGSKILEITVEGEDPQQVRDFVAAVGDETTGYANALYVAYNLELLDAPNVPARPISPKLSLNLILGAILGAFFGLAALLVTSWVRGDFKLSVSRVSAEDELSNLLPLEKELEQLFEQCRQIRTELSETHAVLHITGVEARSVYTMLNDLPKNGHTNGKR